MSKLYWYRVEVYVEDDPAHFGATVLVLAPNAIEAKRLAKPAAISAYNNQAGGWSSKPKVSREAPPTAVRFDPKPGVVMVAGSYER